MALISSKGSYGLRAVYEIYLQESKKPIQTKLISQKTGISQNYLEQLLSTLRKAGVVDSTRGAYGGYFLAKDPSQIIVGDVIEALEGELEVVSNGENCPLRYFYQDIKDRLKEVLNISLPELQTHHEKLLGQLNYSI